MWITWSQVTNLLTGKLDLNDLNRLPTYYTYVNSKSIKILSYNLPSIHKMYEYGNIAIEESFDIIISEKVHILLLQDAMIVTPIIHYSPRRLCFFCLQQEEPTDIVNIASWFLNIHNCFTIGPFRPKTSEWKNDSKVRPGQIGQWITIHTHGAHNNVALSNLRNGHVTLSNLRNCYVPCHYLLKPHVACH